MITGSLVHSTPRVLAALGTPKCACSVFINDSPQVLMSVESMLGTFLGLKTEKAAVISCEPNVLEILALSLDAKGLPIFFSECHYIRNRDIHFLYL